MEATDLYMARVQVAEAVEQGLPWQEATKRGSARDQPIHDLSASSAHASRTHGMRNEIS
jgi:hypothetical protein